MSTTGTAGLSTASLEPPGERTVHLWCVRLDRLGDALEALHAVLAPTEQARAVGWDADVRKRRYAARQGALRFLAARYLGVAPADVPLRRGAGGEPVLAGGPVISVSDSQDVALFAFARHGPIGVDIEHTRAGRPVERIARRMLGDDAAHRLAACRPGLRDRVFHRAWTATEATAKANGAGIFGPFRQTTGLAPLSLTSLEPCTGYVATLASKPEARRIELREWPA